MQYSFLYYRVFVNRGWKISATRCTEGTGITPPLSEQQAIVAEIEAEQKLVNANRDLITRFEAKIQTTLSRIWGETTAES